MTDEILKEMLELIEINMDSEVHIEFHKERGRGRGVNIRIEGERYAVFGGICTLLRETSKEFGKESIACVEDVAKCVIDDLKRDQK